MKKNSLLLLFVAAGTGWLAYSANRGRITSSQEDDEADDASDFDADANFDRPLEYPVGTTAKMEEPYGEYGGASDSMLEQIKQRVSDHPIEIGLGCLAAGVLVGLAIPTPEPVHRLAGPTIDRLRTRTRSAGQDLFEKGKRVVQAGIQAAKAEAQSQGLTLDRTRP